MADKKISALTGATTPLAGTEVLPIVQGGSTVKVSVANLTAGRAITAANVTASGELTTTTNDARISMFRSAGTNYFDWASGQTLAFGTQTSQGGAGRVSKVNFLDNGDLTNVTGNFVVGTAGKGIDFSANTHAAGMTSELLNDYEEGTWVPTVAAGSGSITTVGTVVGNYTRIGRLVTLFASVTITNNGTGSGSIRISGIPFPVSANIPEYVGVGSNGSTAKTINAILNGSQIYVFYYDGAYPVASGQTINISLTYQV
jgi:hypothetical protein